ncbi:MAG: PadR family transcriptional regulator [Deltaproteobacteria bacterium]|nr:PadR family transcriptional regulator [Deltaproteobacteria bacterium]
MCRKKECHDDGCHCPGGKTERFIQPCLLLALRLKSSYGYDLLEKIMDFGFLDGPADPGMVYRHLRKLEEDGFVSSTWDTSGTGPARRYYRITKEGEELLRDWIPFMERNLRSLKKFLQTYRQTLAKKGGKK